MSHWPLVSLARIARPVERAEVPVTGNSYRQVGVKLWGVGAYERESIDGGGTQYKTLSRVEADDIVVNKIWARNGSVAVIPKNLAGCYVSSEFPTFKPIPDELEPRWFHWITKTRFFWNECDAKSQGTSGKNRIRPERFLEIEIPLPPLPEQRRIVARIEELAAKINEARGLRQKAADKAKTLGKFSLKSIVAGGVAKRPLSELCVQITDGEHATPPRVDEREVPLATAKNVRDGYLDMRFTDFVTRHTAENCWKRCKPTDGDVLMVCVGATTGRVCRLVTPPEMVIVRSVALLVEFSIQDFSNTRSNRAKRRRKSGTP